MKVAAMTAMIAHARVAAPDECCGVVLGRNGVIHEVVPTRNVAEHPRTRFVLDPADHIAARRYGRDRGLEVLGFYHSHPHSAAVPSASDVEEASYPDHLYLIVGLAADPPEVRVFGFDNGNIREHAFVTVG